jgi:hypothetical protein
MSVQSMDLFADALRDIAAGPHGTDFQQLTEGLMRRMAEKGATLDQLTDHKMLNRSRRTLEGHCVKFGIRFPDFVPANMRFHIEFTHRGDFLELTGPHVPAVSKALDVVTLERDGLPMCAVPVHGWDDAKSKLRAAGFEAKKAKAPKVKKGKANAQ